MFEILLDFYDFIVSLSFDKFFRMFWYFLIFDFTRYILLELLVIVLDLLKKGSNSVKYQQARYRLFHEKPLISIIVPGKNEGEHIPELARSLHNQTYKNIEIIVVDDGSDDDTELICRQIKKEGLIDKFFRNEIRGGKASAANLAFRYSRGEIIVHLDADSHIYDDAIEQLLIPFYMDEKIGATGGDIRVNNSQDSLSASLQGIEYVKTISISRRISSYLGLLRIISGAFGAFRRETLERIYGWDVGPGLDGDITLKIRKLGMKVKFVPEAICFTNVPRSFRNLAKQRYRWNRSLVRFRLRKHLNLFLPSATYSLKNMITSLDNIFFNVILNINWWLYLLQIFFIYREDLKYIIVINYLLYIVSNFVQFFIGFLLSPNNVVRRKELHLYLYLPLMPLYTGVFLRIIRTYAHIMEFFFRRSYRDPWNPWKVSKQADIRNL